MRPPTLDDLAEIVGAYVDLSSTPVTEKSAFGTDIPIDSQDMLRVLSRIQAQYSFKFDVREVLGVATLGDLLAVVHRRKGGA
ncbi:MAG: acyl carrier protein [Bryobacteraceae bacterium]